MIEEEEKRYQKYLKNLNDKKEKGKSKNIMFKENKNRKSILEQFNIKKKNSKNSSFKSNKNTQELNFKQKLDDNTSKKEINKIEINISENSNKINNISKQLDKKEKPTNNISAEENNINIKSNNNNIKKDNNRDIIKNNINTENNDISNDDGVKIFKKENENMEIKNNNNLDDLEELEENIGNLKLERNKDNDLIYNILLKIKDKENKEISKKMIEIDKSTNYKLDLDKLFLLSTSILNKKKLSYKYGISYKIGYLDLEEKVGVINLLEYDILSMCDERNPNIKNLDMEINIINKDNLSENDLLNNPQLYCKLTKDYDISPKLKFINKCNLFRYTKGLKISFKYLSIIFNKDEIYDLTFVNFDEFSYNGDTEIFFDKNFDIENSSMKKIWNQKLTLIYGGIGIKYKNNEKNKNILIEYLLKRYSCDEYKLDENNNQIILNSEIKNLLISEEESNHFYKEMQNNINEI